MYAPQPPALTVVALGNKPGCRHGSGYAPGAAQTPRTLPADPQNQDRVLNRQQDPQFGSRDDRQYGDKPNASRQPRLARDRNPEGGLERRLAYLHSQLRITPVQEGAWTAFIGALRDERPR